mmetsp:Transcript_3436/g.2895  ORF Transcript_3436/g.2895 Transcript_3436/m.2895 type:complete len:90 (-) Transcript_3436:161-430(-)
MFPVSMGRRKKFRQLEVFINDDFLALKIIYEGTEPNLIKKDSKIPSKPMEELTKETLGDGENLDFLENYPHSIRYESSKGPRRRKRIIT